MKMMAFPLSCFSFPVSRVIAGTVCLVFSASALAQIEPPIIEEVMVTATQRARPLQDIPLSVNSVEAEELAMSGTTDIRGLMNLAPSFQISSSTSETAGTTARIRGVGTQGNNPGLESAVGIFIDGVFRNRNTVGLTDLGNVERIEVLRGPQGTLFGRNTSAGMLHIITKKPEFDATHGYLDLSTGDYSLASARGGISSGNQNLAGSLDFTFTQRDGFFEQDALNGEEYNTRDNFGLRGQLYYEPSDDFDLRIIADVGERDESCCGAMYTEVGARTSYAVGLTNPTQNLISDPNDVFGRVTVTTPGRSYDTEVDEQGLSAEFNLQLGDVKLTSITSARTWEAQNAQDADYSGADILYRDLNDFTQKFDTLTQEFRLNGQTDNLDWLVGFYYSDEQLDNYIGTSHGAAYTPFVQNTLSLLAYLGQNLQPGPPFINLGLLGSAAGDGANDNFSTDSTSMALFTHDTLKLGEQWELTLGLRYTKEEKDLTASIDTIGTSCAAALSPLAGNYQGNGSPITPFVGGNINLTIAELALMCLGGSLNSTLDGNYSDSRSENNSSGTVALSYYSSDDVMWYGSYSLGYKSGGFNLDRSGLDNDSVLGTTNGTPNGTFNIRRDVAALEFADETVDAFELGVKSSFLDNTVQLNVTYFNQVFEDFQLNTFNGLTFFVITVDEVTSEGVEVDLRALMSDNLSINAGAVYNKAQYADDLVASDGSSTAGLAGQELTHAPEWVFTGSLTYDFGLGSWNAFAHVDFRYTGDHNTGSDLDPEKEQDAYTLVNGRVGMVSPDERWSVHLWAQNLTDEDYYQVVFDSPAQNSAGIQALESYNGFLGDPRTFGVTLGYKF